MSTATARLFHLKWNNSKMRRISETERTRPRACVGVHFANGMIALENGAMFTTMDELKHHLAFAGTYELTYEGWQKVTNGELKESNARS